MVDYIGLERVQELVARLGAARFIEGLANEIEADYRRWRDFDKSPRHATHSPVGVIELMPISDGSLYSFKYVNGHPKNTAQGLLTVTAFGVLADVATGYPVLLSELTFTTALRTAAMSALAARYMARPASRSMAMIGNGAQAEFQALAFYHLLGIRELRLFDTDPAATAKSSSAISPCCSCRRCASRAAARPPKQYRASTSSRPATADKRNATILLPEMIEPGMHLNAIGGDCPGKTELHGDILRRPDARVVVEFEPQSRIEGEIQQLEPTFPVVEFADVLTGKAQARTADSDVTIFDSVGFALEDFSALRYLHRLHQEERGTKREIDLLPALADPKDLFGELAGRLAARERIKVAR